MVTFSRSSLSKWKANIVDRLARAMEGRGDICTGKSSLNDALPIAGVMPSNPKQFYGDKKPPLHLFPTTAIAGGCMAFLEGNLKYGRDNFRAAPVEAMTYVRACIGHMMAWGEGRDIDPDSGLDELFKAVACVAILIDAKYAGSLIDNRKYPGGFHALYKSLEDDVARMYALHGDKTPKHYTIKDAA